MSRLWMCNGYIVEPVPGSYRRVAGGYAVDVRCDHDQTCPLSYWTANAAEVTAIEDGGKIIYYREKLSQGY